MTSFYMWRLMYMTFYGSPRMDEHTAAHVHESPKTMTVPLMVLAAGSALGGWIGVPLLWSWFGDGFRLFEHWLEPVFEPAAAQVALLNVEAHHDVTTEWGLMGLSVLLAVCGILLARYLYSTRPEATESIQQATGPMHGILLNKWYVDEIYDFLFINGLCKGGGRFLGRIDQRIVDGGVNGAGWITRFSSRISGWWDTWIVDGTVRLVSFLVMVASYPVRILQTGYLQSYALVILVGVAVALGYFLLRG